MKKISLLLVLTLIASLLCAPCAMAEEVVNVYNWYDYMDERVFELFEQETGIAFLFHYQRGYDGAGSHQSRRI